MLKPEAEKTIRHLCHVWRGASGNDRTPEADLSFTSFWIWCRDEYPDATNFRATGGPRYIAELWFDQEFRQAHNR
jgi:hypothetical protein